MVFILWMYNYWINCLTFRWSPFPVLQPVLQWLSLTIPLVYFVNGTFSVVLYLSLGSPEVSAEVEEIHHLILLKNPSLDNKSKQSREGGRVNIKMVIELALVKWQQLLVTYLSTTLAQIYFVFGIDYYCNSLPETPRVHPFISPFHLHDCYCRNL